MRQLVATAAIVLMAAPCLAGAPQMYKCIEGSRTVYQQQACPVHPDPEPAASAAHTVAKASAGADAASAGERKLKRPSPAASSAPATPR